jgi:hypothetical protein
MERQRQAVLTTPVAHNGASARDTMLFVSVLGTAVRRNGYEVIGGQVCSGESVRSEHCYAVAKMCFEGVGCCRIQLGLR